MPRYVEAVQGAEIISEKMNIPLADLVDVFADIPTADVAPKSEVDWHREAELNAEHIMLLQSQIDTLREINNSLLEAGQEWQKRYENLAREIFEEIEKYWIKSDTLPDCARLVDLDKIAELKKKYSEERDESGIDEHSSRTQCQH